MSEPCRTEYVSVHDLQASRTGQKESVIQLSFGSGEIFPFPQSGRHKLRMQEEENPRTSFSVSRGSEITLLQSKLLRTRLYEFITLCLVFGLGTVTSWGFCFYVLSCQWRLHLTCPSRGDDSVSCCTVDCRIWETQEGFLEGRSFYVLLVLLDCWLRFLYLLLAFKPR